MNGETASVLGRVFNIQRYSVHDGPGVRSIVFFKGCPLACRWCSNPEGIKPWPQVVYRIDSCIGVDVCSRCVRACPGDAVSAGQDGRALLNHALCERGCRACVDVCPAKAIEVAGTDMTVDAVMGKVAGDDAFYRRSGGGITLSGGEPLLQPEFASALLDEAHRWGLSTAIETTGYASWSVVEQVLSRVDTIQYDLKSVDEKTHCAFTGVGCSPIKENFVRLCRAFPEKHIIARTPVVPRCNDSIEELQAIVDFISEAKGSADVAYEMLPYHSYGESKYANLGIEYSLGDIPNMKKEEIDRYKTHLITDVVLV
ncbi:MAG: glycyl-radical enzyme activating protein [Gordonibacter sp.]|uniref:glycyl-radical enzyme activating protein n=1 Tax=Gordonibacter sp. TaxID=1968902 RepID=UPI002FC61B5E